MLNGHLWVCISAVKVSKRDLNVRPRNLLLFGFPVILHISEMVTEDSTED